ncbi:TTC28 [Symbiodinium pilosum]|uniref:TTC28 protein n=1 Tax=Symbiodinium pilosum TaxID=2952 RepID=A0A812TCE8_SYMPI|nr:TTC28 [Symbiodinium pilosum]
MGACGRQFGRWLWAGECISLGARCGFTRGARALTSDGVGASPFPDFDDGLQKELDDLGRPGLQEERYERQAFRSSNQRKIGANFAPDDSGDFILSLAVRRHVTGYVLLRFRDLLPLQLGLVDYAKHGPDEAQKKGLDVLAVLRDLRQTAPKKLLQFIGEEDTDILEEEFRNRQWKWVVAMDDSTIDRGPPKTVRESHAQRTVSMLQGLVIADCKRIFKSAPQVIHPRRSRLHVGVRGGPTEEARKAVFDIASKEVPDFPVIRYRSGTISEDSLVMSDAWASARMAQRVVLLAHKREDQKLMNFLRQQAIESKQIKKLAQVVSELYPRRESKDLSDVMEKKIEAMVEDKLNKFLDEAKRTAKSFVVFVAGFVRPCVESDDELPPLVGSGSQATTASHTASPPKQDVQKPPEDADEEDDDELPPLISQLDVRWTHNLACLLFHARQKLPSSATLGDRAGVPWRDEMIWTMLLMSSKMATTRKPSFWPGRFSAKQPGSQKNKCYIARAQGGDAEREADALRVVAKARIKAAEHKGFEGLPDIEVLEQALQAANSEIFTFQKHGEIVAKAVMQLALAEIYLAMDSHAQALPAAQQSLSAMHKADAPTLRHIMAYRALADIYLAQGRCSLVTTSVGPEVARMASEARVHASKRPSDMAEAGCAGCDMAFFISLHGGAEHFFCSSSWFTPIFGKEVKQRRAVVEHEQSKGLAAFWHDLSASAGEVNLEAKEGGFHEFSEHLSSSGSREANIHPAVLMPFLIPFDVSGRPFNMTAATAAIVVWLKRMQSWLLLSWLSAIGLLLWLHIRGENASCPLRVMASVSTLKTALLNFYFQGFSARLTDPLVPAWALLIIAFAQLADGGIPEARWVSRWCNKAIMAVMVTSYFLAGCYKLSAAGLNWMDGTVLQHYAGLYMREQQWSKHLFAVLCRAHAWPVLCSCGLLFEILCPLALFYPSMRHLVVGTAIVFHLGNLFLITLNGDRFLTWVWTLLFVVDFPAALVRNVAIVAGAWSEPVLSSDDAFLLQVPAVQSPALVSKHVAPTVSLQTSYGLLATFVMAVWLSIGIPRSVNLVHTDWPFVGPDMFSHIGRWSSPSPFQDILQDQMNGQRRKA